MKIFFTSQILDEYKRAPDIVVNSAGITKDGFMLRMKDTDFDKVCKGDICRKEKVFLNLGTY